VSVRIQLLGTLRVDSPDGVLHEADLRGRRAVLLFARLAAELGQGVPSDVLAEAVWGWSPPPSWPAALRNTIAVVRSALDTVGLPGLLQYARGAYVLDLPVGSTVDLLEVQAAASAAELAMSSDDWSEVRWICARALEAASGTFLPGPATPWVEDMRSELVQVVARTRRVAGEAALAAGDLVEAEAIGRRLVADAPLRRTATGS
jgi:two-component SAPR family response regulator